MTISSCVARTPCLGQRSHIGHHSLVWSIARRSAVGKKDGAVHSFPVLLWSSPRDGSDSEVTRLNRIQMEIWQRLQLHAKSVRMSPPTANEVCLGSSGTLPRDPSVGPEDSNVAQDGSLHEYDFSNSHSAGRFFSLESRDGLESVPRHS